MTSAKTPSYENNDQCSILPNPQRDSRRLAQNSGCNTHTAPNAANTRIPHEEKTIYPQPKQSVEYKQQSLHNQYHKQPKPHTNTKPTASDTHNQSSHMAKQQTHSTRPQCQTTTQTNQITSIKHHQSSISNTRHSKPTISISPQTEPY
ncbi:hypothetical protein T265_03942 [Opisthorchis viverrini]|uniref:Uncharacterized protein n=1 Tax=Opisthorchis viverrini TaxID=6198 RepID=A0A074ZPX3_OPIVI|nr:hypothetical protein T265_03939 [Opisthorchis viverrini]XP_009166804.1 hypothetical protein T265_03940 [Opisthorchis viverrini]XP_009166805.1 hypothetical protein T265_03941 [Opisthorchis viverrini]XP_009166806.1 hypothetical protein T265_03942 [Opisthorchis viverrini]KER29472.1 hypothetical protein T265_03939 [Opisthorchis viverrini]KER29473.1 hypothetical protein T265_03940 [Opisthorchis viverrini]KER29474.1 hypothetical protein T265_03941 [Opisthorchis viverrini]KER29475.1 hypothetical